MFCVRPLDLSADETMQEILDADRFDGTKRLVNDSLSRLSRMRMPSCAVSNRTPRNAQCFRADA